MTSKGVERRDTIVCEDVHPPPYDNNDDNDEGK